MIGNNITMGLLPSSFFNYKLLLFVIWKKISAKSLRHYLNELSRNYRKLMYRKSKKTYAKRFFILKQKHILGYQNQMIVETFVDYILTHGDT